MYCRTAISQTVLSLLKGAYVVAEKPAGPIFNLGLCVRLFFDLYRFEPGLQDRVLVL